MTEKRGSGAPAEAILPRPATLAAARPQDAGGQRWVVIDPAWNSRSGLPLAAFAPAIGSRAPVAPGRMQPSVGGVPAMGWRIHWSGVRLRIRHSAHLVTEPLAVQSVL